MSPASKDPPDNVTRHRIVPRPGAGRAGNVDARSAPTIASVRPAVAAVVRPPDPEPDLPAVPLSEFVAGTSNRLLNAAMPLIALIGRLRLSVNVANVPRIRQQAVAAARDCQSRLAKLHYPDTIATDAHYILCTAIDSAALSTPWGAQSEWATQSLLVTFHGDAWGGKRFFEILDQACGNPTSYIDLLELQYACLALGFSGKYQADPQGAARLLEKRDEAYRRIRDVRGAPPETLSVRWQGEHDRRHRLVRYVPFWVVAAVVATVVLAFFLYYTLALHHAAAPLKEGELAQLGTGRATYVRTAQPTGSTALTLKQLLSDQERAHVLTVEETDRGTLVSLIADDLFGSASATLNSRHVATVQQIAIALNQVPGRITVIGHTDDQPLKSVRYPSNLELSRARAETVKNLLASKLHEPGRLEWMGLGSTSPRYKPPDPDYRAKNRRVEILLQPI
jgi:type VI secretion system protein ImpK